MDNSGDQLKKSGLATGRVGVRRFLERRFDWIALVVITLLILCTLVYF